MASLVRTLARLLRDKYIALIYSMALALNGYKFLLIIKYIYDLYWYNDATYHIYPWQRWLSWANHPSTDPMILQSHPLWLLAHLLTAFLLMHSIAVHFVESWHKDEPMVTVCTKTSSCNYARVFFHITFCSLLLARMSHFGTFNTQHSMLLNGIPLLLLFILYWMKWLFAYFFILTLPVLFEILYLVYIVCL